LFVSSTATALEIAQSVFPNLSISSSMSQNGVSVAEIAGDLTTRVMSSPGRIDFIWEARSKPPEISEGDVSVEGLSGPFASVSQFASTLPVSRVAAILTYRERVESPEQAMGRARAELSGIVIPPEATEVTYRLNVPSQVEKVEMNRIVTWQTSKVAVFGMHIGAGNVMPQQFLYDVWDRTVDVNTVQETPLSNGAAGEALDKVLQEAVRLGDVGFKGL
jgi:hypothetical protein